VKINDHKTKGDRWFRGSPAEIVVLSVMGSNFIMIGKKASTNSHFVFKTYG